MVAKKSEYRKEWEKEYHARLEVHEKYIDVYYPKHYRKKLQIAIRHFNFTKEEVQAIILGGDLLDDALQKRNIRFWGI